MIDRVNTLNPNPTGKSSETDWIHDPFGNEQKQEKECELFGTFGIFM